MPPVWITKMPARDLKKLIRLTNFTAALVEMVSWIGR